MTRRDWLHTVVFATAARHAAAEGLGAGHIQTPAQANAAPRRRLRGASDALDHLLLGAADLDAGIAWWEAHTGVRAAIGGTHPGRGTRNALLALGGRQYLEIIAPDPAQKVFDFQIDLRKLAAPRFVTWAAWSADLDAEAAAAAKAGVGVSGPRDGSRARPDGTVLRWRVLSVTSELAEPEIDPVPFFIQWAKEARHPSQDAPVGCRLIGLEFDHPQALKLVDTLASVGIAAKATPSAKPALRVTVETPRGTIVL